MDLGDIPPRSEIDRVPFYFQNEYQCGPAALAMVFNWSGVEVTPEGIASEIYTPERKGSLQPLLISAVRHRDRLPYVTRDFEALLQEVASGHPVLVLQNLGLSWYPRL